MFDQILNLVKEQIGGNPQIANTIPAERKDDVHREVAAHVDKSIKEQATSQGGIGGLLSGLANGGSVANSIQGGVAGAIGSKLGLPPAATGAIAAALPGILQKFAHKANDPNDPSITPEGLSKSLGINMGNLF